ncbi:MAG: hypothetical protein NDI81_18185 [Desulfobacula sp.]|nr:hypothetical protein [Desulfobacula sp.]
MDPHDLIQNLADLCRQRLLPLLAAAVLMLWAGPALSAEEHACDYLTKDEVQTVMGTGIGEIKAPPANPMGQSVCFFDIPSDTAVRFAQLQMFRTGWAKGKKWTAKSLFENNMSFLDSLQEIPGIGEKAYWGGSGLKLGAGLHVLYKDTYFTAQAATGDPAANLEKAKALAVLVIKKIK